MGRAQTPARAWPATDGDARSGSVASPPTQPVAELRYRIAVTDPGRRELRVTLELPAEAWGPAAADGLRELFLPTWTPGSYLIREFSRHLGPVECVAADGSRHRCQKTSKNRFAIPATFAGPYRLEYTVHAHELSVRTSHVDDSHAYWNHACVLLWPVGHPEHSARLEVVVPAGWRTACALPGEPITAGDANSTTGVWHAADLDAALDAPFLAGQFVEFEVAVHDVSHRIVLDSLRGVPPPATLPDDFAALIASAAEVFGGQLPYPRYLFLCLFTDEGHGGLEHAESTTLLASRTALHDRKGYQEFLSLAVHELFHAWNVKRMRPREFWRYDYENENYSRLLWLMEGWTAYFDDLLTLRAGHYRPDEYLATIAGNLERMLANPGRFVASLAESSFDAWIRLYRPDANTRNSSQNYYGNGAVAALCLDLYLRQHAPVGRSLETVIQRLYEQTFGKGRGYTRADVDAAVAEAGGEPAVQLLAELVDGNLDPELGARLEEFGVTLGFEGGAAPFFGITFEGGGTTVASVQRGSPADQAGLAPGDELLALGDLRVTSSSWRKVLAAVVRVGEPIEVLRARRGVLGKHAVVPTAARGTPRLTINRDADPAKVARRESWLRTRAARSAGPQDNAQDQA